MRWDTEGISIRGKRGWERNRSTHSIPHRLNNKHCLCGQEEYKEDCNIIKKTTIKKRWIYCLILQHSTQGNPDHQRLHTTTTIRESLQSILCVFCFLFSLRFWRWDERESYITLFHHSPIFQQHFYPEKRAVVCTDTHLDSWWDIWERRLVNSPLLYIFFLNSCFPIFYLFFTFFPPFSVDRTLTLHYCLQLVIRISHKIM